MGKNRDTLIFVIVGIVALLAFITKPDLDAHQTKVKAIFDQAQQNARSKFDIGAMIGLGAIQTFSQGQFKDNIFFTTYETDVLKCTGLLGQVSCSTKK